MSGALTSIVAFWRCEKAPFHFIVVSYDFIDEHAIANYCLLMSEVMYHRRPCTNGKKSIFFFLYFIYTSREFNLRTLIPFWRFFEMSWIKKVKFLHWKVVVAKVKLVARMWSMFLDVSLLTAIVPFITWESNLSSQAKAGACYEAEKYAKLCVCLVWEGDQKVSDKWFI